MPEFLMQRDRRVATSTGHVYLFAKGVPQHVAPAAVREVMEAGAAPTDASFVPDAQEGENLLPATPVGDERKQKIITVFKQLVARNERGDFDAGGKPALKVLTALCGFDIDAKERNALWSEHLSAD